MSRALKYTTAAVLAAAAVLLLLVLPPAPRRLASAAPADPLVAKGVLHVHTTRSDGAGTADEVAAAAARSGVRFVVLTDHGDGRELQAPAYRSGVLCLDGAEISTDHGHVAAIGTKPAEYRLGGHARDVIEDIHRLGGIAIVTHPTSAKEALRWRAWEAPFNGIEWLNGDSEWRDERALSLARAGLGYWLRPAAALARLFDRPVEALARADALSARRDTVIIAGHDAHGRMFGTREESASRVPAVNVPSYEAAFGSFAVRAMLDTPLTGEAAQDAATVTRALRHGRVYTAIDALAGPASLRFMVQSGSAGASIGDRIIPAGPLEFSIRAEAPDGAQVVLLHNGKESAEGPTPELRVRVAPAPGAYRAEVRIPGAPGAPPVPWIVSSPIYVGLRPVGPIPEELTIQGAAVSDRWVIEHAPDSAGVLSAENGRAEFRYQLGSASSSPFVALVHPVQIPADAAAVSFAIRADRPGRVSVQLRSPERGGEGVRWRRSVYVDDSERLYVIPWPEFTAVGNAPADLNRAAADSLLFVIDTVNADPGVSGEVSVSEVNWRRR